jgi:hypothetical protein
LTRAIWPAATRPLATCPSAGTTPTTTPSS